MFQRKKFSERDDPSTALSDQLTVVSYFGRREFVVPDIFKLVGDKKYACIYEPFSGCAAISFAAMKAGLAKNFVINESFPLFEVLWKLIKNHSQELVSVYSELVKKYYAESKDKRLDFYNDLLAEFNEKYHLNMVTNAAILFVFLMNFSDNHIPYFDEQLNMSAHPNVFIDNATEARVISQFEKRVHDLSAMFHSNQILFLTGDFEASLTTVAHGDLVILDPPYPRQAENVYFKLHREKALQANIRATLERLSKNNIDFVLFYGSRIVGLENQFDEDQYNLHHLVRMTKHQDYGYFADHIYISRTISLSHDALPRGMEFYHSFFNRNEEMTQTKYQSMMHTLLAQLQENTASLTTIRPRL